jgi:uncharacterized protein
MHLHLEIKNNIMKKIVLIVFSLAIVCMAMSQANSNTLINPFPKTVAVSGSAEMEIIPDEIYVQVDLREYEKRGSGKINLEAIKTKFVQACKNAGIPDSAVSITSYEGYDRSYWLTKKKKTPDMMASISYQVKFSNAQKIDQLVEHLDDEATQSFYITRTSHSKITEYRKLLKIQAVKAAKEKAIYLSEAIGEKAGEAVTIQEPVEASVYPVFNQGYLSNNISQARVNVNDVASEPGTVDFKKIKLRFEVTAMFALK